MPTAQAVHLEGGSSVSVDWLWTLQVTNRIMLFRRRNSAPPTAALLVVTLPVRPPEPRSGRSKNSAAAVRLLGPHDC